jgi:hypothetical protein
MGLTPVVPLDPAIRRTGTLWLRQMIAAVTVFEYASLHPRDVVFADQRNQ